MSEVLRRSEEIFLQMRAGKISTQEGKELLQKLHSLLDTLEPPTPESTPLKPVSLHVATPYSISLPPADDDDEEGFEDCHAVTHSEEKKSPRDMRKEFEGVTVDPNLSLEIRQMHGLLMEHANMLNKICSHLFAAELTPAATSTTTAATTTQQAEDEKAPSPSKSLVFVKASGAVKGDKDSVILARQNPHPSDAVIELDAITGNYKVIVEVESVASVIRSYCKQFNADEAILTMKQSASWGASNKYFGLKDDEIKLQWEKVGLESVALSDAMHTAIAQFYNNDVAFETNTSPEIARNFLKFHDEVIFRNRQKPYRSYWHIFDAESRLATTVDMAFQTAPTNAYKQKHIAIYDFRRVKELKVSGSSASGNSMFKPMEHLPDNNYIHYSLQLNLSRYILEKKYGKIVEKMYIVLLHPDLKTYAIKEVPRMDKEVADIAANRIIRNPIIPKNLALSTIAESPSSNTRSSFFSFA